jgi:hypothetical protein
MHDKWLKIEQRAREHPRKKVWIRTLQRPCLLVHKASAQTGELAHRLAISFGQSKYFVHLFDREIQWHCLKVPDGNRRLVFRFTLENLRTLVKNLTLSQQSITQTPLQQPRERLCTMNSLLNPHSFQEPWKVKACSRHLALDHFKALTLQGSLYISLGM